MTDLADAGHSSEVQLASGRVAILSCGPSDGRLVICVPGLSQDERSLATLALGLATERRRAVAVSLRGRGRSETTVPGTFGLPAHARDVLELASTLGAAEFDLVGWSMGGLVGMQVAAVEPGRLGHLVLLDIAGKPEAAAVDAIVAGLERLGAVYASPQEYVERVTASGVVDGCREAWTEYLPGDLVPVDAGGFTSRTSRDAAVEDAVFNSRLDPYEMWRALSMPTLLVRSTVPITAAGGYVVSAADARRFATEVARAQVVEVPANHFCIGFADPALRAIRAFLDA